MKKLALVLAAAVLLGGCTLGSKFMGRNDDAQKPTPMPSSTVTTGTDIDSMPDISTSTDAKSIESDLNATIILDEDFSNLD